MNSLIKHLEREIEILGWDLKDEMNKMMVESVRKLIEVFSEQGHSGSSAPYAINLFSKLANYEILSPLTGDDNEWIDSNKLLLQNKRLSSVFKDKITDENKYIKAIVWVEKDSNKNSSSFIGTVNNICSSQKISFPFTPKTFYIEVEVINGNEYKIIDEKELEKALKYYNN